MSDLAPKRVVLADANVLINLIHVGRLDILGALPGLEFVVPDDVALEITDAQQRVVLERACEAGQVQRVSIDTPENLTVFVTLRAIMGAGEAACLALATAFDGSIVASDELRTFRREVRARLGEGRLLTTPGIFLLAIRAGLMTVAQADADKALLETHRFRMSFVTFADLV